MGSSKVINTSVIKDNIALLENERRYFSNKKASFSKNAYGSASNLVNYLGKIQEIYNTIAQNISNLNDYLKSYVNDAEGLESQMAGRGGTVSVDSVNSIINRYENTINNFKIDSDNIFVINEYNATLQATQDNNPSSIEKGIATVATCGLSFLEGVVNVGEMLVDGGAMIASVIATPIFSIFGNDEIASSIGEFVQKDLSKDWYHSVVSSYGYDRYIDPDGTAASICSIAGNIVGMVGLSVLTGGAAAGAFGAGTATATAVTMGVNMGIGALTNMGSEGQLALERGANINEAQAVAAVAGAVGLAQGAISGKLDAAARGVGASVGKSGLGKIVGYTTAAFGIGASEPLINEMVQTAIYRKTEETGLVDSFLTNAEEDGLLFQMALAGGMNALGTYGNGLGGIKRYNTLASQIDEAMNGTDTKVIELANISEISSDLEQRITNSTKALFKVGEDLYTYTDGSLNKLDDIIDYQTIAKNSDAYASSLSSITQSMNIKTATDLEENLLSSIADGRRQDFNDIVQKICKYTDTNLPEGYSSVTEMKDTIVKKLIDSGTINKMTNGDFYTLIVNDDYIFKKFIGNSKLDNLLTKNLKNSSLVDCFGYLSKKLNQEEIKEVFDTPTLKDFFTSLTDDEYLNIANKFMEINKEAFFTSDSFINRYINLSKDNKMDFLLKNNLKISVLDNENSKIFLQSILDDFGNEEYLMNHPKLAFFSILNSYKYDFYYYPMTDLKNKVENALIEKLQANSLVPFPESISYKMPNKYYDITLEIDGKTSVSTIKQITDFEILEAFGLENYDDIMTGKYKIISIAESPKSVLTLNDIPTKGLNKVTLEINGHIEQLVVNNQGTAIDLSNNRKLSNIEIKTAKILDIEPLAETSYNKVIDIANSSIDYYEITYTIDGIEHTYYLSPYKGTLNIDYYIEQNNLYNIDNVNIKEADVNAVLKNKTNIFKNQNAINIFNDKYGGNQSDVSRIVVSSLEGETLSEIDKNKSEILINLIKKYYPEATEKDIKNIAKTYAEHGCGYMAVSNEFLTYIDGLENGSEIFEKNFGYKLFIDDGMQKSYNLEPLALEYFLNSQKNIENLGDINSLLENAHGIKAEKYSAYMTDFFNKKGINVDISISATIGNGFSLYSLLNANDNSFITIGSSGFDLETLSDFVDLPFGEDKALANVIREGNLQKNVGSHAMTVTGITDNNELIVSSWSGKYKFIPTVNTQGVKLYQVKFEVDN